MLSFQGGIWIVEPKHFFLSTILAETTAQHKLDKIGMWARPQKFATCDDPGNGSGDGVGSRARGDLKSQPNEQSTSWPQIDDLTPHDAA